MNCYLHTDRQAQLHCAACGNLICDACDVVLSDHHVCKKCLAEAKSVPPELAALPDAQVRRPLGNFNLGAVTVPLVIGGVMGFAGGSVWRLSQDFERRIFALFCAVFAGVIVYLLGALLTVLFVPSGTIRAKGGVLGLFGVTDYATTLFWTLLVAAIFWFSMN